MSRPLVFSALAIIAVIFVVLFASAIQSHQHARLLQKELDQAKEQIGQANAILATAQSQSKEKDAHTQELITELEKTKKETFAQLAAEKEATQKQFETITNEATKKLSESEKRAADLTEQLKSVSSRVQQLTAERDAAQSRLSDTQSELSKAKEATQQANAKLEATEAEFEKAKEAAEDEFEKAKEAAKQANARVTELESAGANTAKEAERERGKLQAALDQANTEIERLKSELEKPKSTPPEQGESVSPTPGERPL